MLRACVVSVIKGESRIGLDPATYPATFEPMIKRPHRDALAVDAPSFSKPSPEPGQLERIRAGDERAFEDLFKSYYQTLCTFVDGYALDLSGRYYIHNAPSVLNPDFMSTGEVSVSKPNFFPEQTQNQTFGAQIAVIPASWWRNVVTVGIDRMVIDRAQTQPRLTTPEDTLLQTRLASIASPKSRRRVRTEVACIHWRSCWPTFDGGSGGS